MPRTPAALREVTQLAFLILVFGWLVTVIKENDMSRASDLERQMLGLINEERTSRGLGPVQLELRLNESSEDHSQWMLDEDRFSHAGVDGSSAGDRMRDADFEFEGNWRWGENIAYQSERGEPGFEDDVVDLHVSLMNSPGHRANILNPNYEIVGLGIEVGDFNGLEATNGSGDRSENFSQYPLFARKNTTNQLLAGS